MLRHGLELVEDRKYKKELLEKQDVTFFHDLAMAAQNAMEADAEKAMRIFTGNEVRSE